MALKRTSRSRKRELEQPDRFEIYSARILEFINRHKNKFVASLTIVLVLGIGFAGMRYFAAHQENKAFELLGQSVGKYQAAVEQSGPEKAFRDVEGDFQRIANEYSGNNGGKLAGFVLADICYQAGDYDQAIALYEQAVLDFEGHAFLKNLALSGLGYSHEAKKDYAAAARFFEEIASAPAAGFKDEALFNLSGIYAITGESEKRADALKKIVSDHSDSLYFKIASEKVEG